MPVRDLFDFLTLSTALVGAMLGAISLLLHFDGRRVKLRVRPSSLLVADGLDGKPVLKKDDSRLQDLNAGFAIEVTNLSAFPITIREVGLTHFEPWTDRVLRFRKGWDKIGRSNISTGLPKRLESREFMTALIQGQQAGITKTRVDKAYAVTACGEFRIGDSPALEELRQLQKSAK